MSQLEQGIAYAAVSSTTLACRPSILAPKDYADFLREAQGNRCDCRLSERRYFVEDILPDPARRMRRAPGACRPSSGQVVAHHHEIQSGSPSAVPAIAGLGCRFAVAIGYPAVPGLVTSGYQEISKR